MVGLGVSEIAWGLFVDWDAIVIGMVPSVFFIMGYLIAGGDLMLSRMVDANIEKASNLIDVATAIRKEIEVREKALSDK